jgi:hypothetical protein
VICRVACAASSRVLLRCENIPLSQYRSWDGIALVVIKLFGMHFSFQPTRGTTLAASTEFQFGQYFSSPEFSTKRTLYCVPTGH